MPQENLKERYQNDMQTTAAPKQILEQPKVKKSIGKYIGRGAAVFFTLLLLAVYSIFALCYVNSKKSCGPVCIAGKCHKMGSRTIFR